jgi:hypothetical protein
MGESEKIHRGDFLLDPHEMRSKKGSVCLDWAENFGLAGQGSDDTTSPWT